MNRATAPIDLYGRHYRPGEFLPFYVPRERMPQVDEKFTVRMIVDAAQGESLPTLEVLPPCEIRAHQRIDHRRAAAMSPAIRAKPIIISSDGYVVDGNHRWWAHVKAGSEAIPVIRLALDFDEAIRWLLDRPYVYTIRPTTPERN
jgi:hypothetical protein